MKVLVLNGSPKGEKSNSMCLTRAFLAGAGWGDAEIVDVAKAGVKGCLGCYACWNKTPGKCVIDDGMEMILTKMIAADVVIWSFPLYYFSVPGGLKNVIDRQLPLNLPFMSEGNESGGHPARYDLTGQRQVVISTCGFWTAQGNYEAVTAMFDHFNGKGNYTAIFCGQGELFRVPELKGRTEAYLEIVRQAGAEFADGGIAEETKEELAVPLFPREVFEKMADASWGIDPDESSYGGRNSHGERNSQGDKNSHGERNGHGDKNSHGERNGHGDKNSHGERNGHDDKNSQDENGLREAEENTKALAAESRRFTIQMAALYCPDGKERILEIYYSDLDRTFQLLLTGQGSRVITEDFRPYTTRIETPYPVWRAIARGEITGQEALFQRQYKVLGDFELMLKWDDLFGSRPVPEKKEEKPVRKTNMLLLLAPWMMIWIVMAINPVVGSVAGIGAAACIPLLWLFFKPVIYEQFSVPMVAGVSLAVLLGADIRLIVPGSYLLFGLLWFISAFRPVPLSAHYSAAGYGGEKAFVNPLFIRTNRILTAAWGILYLATPIWTYILMGTELSSYVGIINSVFPTVLGMFTAWFPKWYPARYARG